MLTHLDFRGVIFVHVPGQRRIEREGVKDPGVLDAVVNRVLARLGVFDGDYSVCPERTKFFGGQCCAPDEQANGRAD